MSDPQMNTFLTGISAMTHSEDPNHEVYLRTCFVCGSTSKPGQDFIHNYGGIVCYGCRAFFRRSHQSTKTTNYVCKNSSCCPVATENRQSCKSCRYTRCLRAGMSCRMLVLPLCAVSSSTLRTISSSSTSSYRGNTIMLNGLGSVKSKHAANLR